MQVMSNGPLLHYIRNDCHFDYSAATIEMKNSVREVGARNMLIQRTLDDLMRKLEASGISAIVLKGCHLIQNIYPFGIRPLEDIDLLLKRKDFELADQIFHDLGYTDCAEDLDVWTHLQISNKLTYTNNSVPLIPIDIHFSLGPSPYLGRIDEEILFNNTKKLVTQSGDCAVLQTEILLIHLCLHLFQHQAENWQKSSCDIIAVIQQAQYPIDWNKFVGIVKKYKLSLPIIFSLNKTIELAPKEIIPTSVLHEIGIMKTSTYEQLIFNFYKRQMNYLEKHLLQFITTPGILRKLHCFLIIIVPRSSFLEHYFSGSYSRYLASIFKTVTKSIRKTFYKK